MMAPLARIRLRLTLWYVATFALILLLLGGGLFYAVRAQIGRELDESLRDATAELIRAANIREMEAADARGEVVDAVDELHIPERQLYLLSATAEPLKPNVAERWVIAAARDAERSGSADLVARLVHDRSLRVHAERFTVQSGRSYIAVAVADQIELEDRYATLIASFSATALAALLLVAAGGYILMRQSSAPVEHTMRQMRRFMADAAHELRTPIAVLRSRAEIALQRPRDAGAYVAALQGVEEESRRMGEIVEDLLTLARADAGERPVSRERLYLDDIALDAADAARVLAGQRGVSLDIGAFEEAAILGDRALIRQLIMILLDNAVKYTPQGGMVRVHVSGNGGSPTLVVEDTGVGVTTEQLPHVFERFYRGESARSHTTGAGLGLSIARWIADVHGASLQLIARAEGGTRVLLMFPLASRM
ncbi:MAG: sensor histidine kinase [Gemmatimonadaceae bacterium]